MASQVAPGYNPEVSLLQGGNAPILPVQGGGSMTAGSSLPPDYNPNNSLLNTGSTVPIVPIRGGGEQAGGGETAFKEYYIEKYTPVLGSEDIPTIENLKSELQTKIREYKGAVKLKKLTSFLRDPVPYTSDDIDNPTYRICPTETRNISGLFLQRVRRRILTITEENPVIVVIPEINGEISKFLQYSKLVSDPDKKIQAGTYVIFVGNFFSSNWQENALLYHQFLERKALNPNNLYLLNNVSYDFAKASCDLFRNIYADVGLDRVLAPFLEPDVILFKNQHIILRSCELPVAEGTTDVKLSEILKKPNPEKYKDVVIVPKLNTYDSLPFATGSGIPEQKYFTIDMNPTTTKYMSFPKKTEILCPKGKTCQGFEGGYRLDQEDMPPLGILDDRKLGPPQLYVIYKNTDKMPFFKEAGSTLTAEELASLAGKEEGKPKEEPKPKEEGKPKEESKPTAIAAVPAKQETKEEPEIPEGDMFKADPLAWKTMITVPVELNSFHFSLRTASEPPVKDDWLAGKFTQDEVDFLNMLQVTPSLVEKAFGKKGGRTKIAEFLEQCSLSNCFEDTSLLSQRECSNAQAFIRDLYFAKLNTILEKMYDELGVLKPLDFMDAILLLKNLLKEKAKGILQLKVDEFDGDFFDPFNRIHYDAINDEYFIDFAEVPEGFPKDPIQYKAFRLRSMNADAILQDILKRFVEETKEKKTFLDSLRGKFRTPPLKDALTGLKRAMSPSRFSGMFSQGERKDEEEEEASPGAAASSASAAASARLRSNTEESAATTSRPGFLSRLRIPRANSGPAGPATPAGSPPATPPATPIPESPAVGGFTLAALNTFFPPKDYFTTIEVKDDGLCFYRAVLKGLQENPVPEPEGSSVYDPSKEDSLAFITQIKNELQTNKANYMIHGENYEDYFNSKYERKGDEPIMIEEPYPVMGEDGNQVLLNGVPQYSGLPLTPQQKEDRIRIGDKYYKMTYDEYLNRMDGPENDRVWAEMVAGLGEAAANLKDIIIVTYDTDSRDSTKYGVRIIYINNKYNSGLFPVNKIVFLYNVNQNHYNLLKLKPGNESPERWPRPSAGGGEEELIDLGVAVGGGEEDLLDLGVAVVRRFTRRNKNRNHK